MEDSDSEEEEHFPTVALDDEHWTSEEIPDRVLCIHEHPSLDRTCIYPCPYQHYLNTSYSDLDISDISKLGDLMTTSSDEDIPELVI